jgi:hypothetical protein
MNNKLSMKNGLIVDKFGSKFYYLNDKYHREDGPAVEFSDGSKYWYINGKRHREDGPAIEYKDGDKKWFINGIRHREDGPAIELANGSKSWYLNGREIICKDNEEFLRIINLIEFM